MPLKDSLFGWKLAMPVTYLSQHLQKASPGSPGKAASPALYAGSAGCFCRLPPPLAPGCKPHIWDTAGRGDKWPGHLAVLTSLMSQQQVFFFLIYLIFAIEKGWIAPFPVSEKAWYCSSAPTRTDTCLRDTANVLFHNRKLQGDLLHFPPPVVRLMAFCLLTPSASHLRSPLSYMPNRATQFLPIRAVNYRFGNHLTCQVHSSVTLASIFGYTDKKKGI